MIDNNNEFINSEPTPTPTPSTPVTPIPGSAPIDYQTATTYRVDNSDGSYDIMDAINGGRLYSVYPDGSVYISIYEKAADGSNERLYRTGSHNYTTFDISNVSYDDRTATITVRNSQGYPVCTIKNKYLVESYSYPFSDTIDVKKYDNTGIYIGHEVHKNGIITVYSPDEIKTKKIFEDGSSEVYENGNIIEFDSNNNKVKTIFPDGSYETYEDGKIIEYSVHGEKSYYFSEDGKKVYLKSGEENFTLYPDGTFYNFKEATKGKYTIDSNGNITCVDDEGNTYLYDSYGKIIKKVDNTGQTTNYEYDYDTMKKTVNQNGQQMVSLINHIEYDKERYNHILTTLNDISSTNRGNINSTCSSIENTIQKFPDSYFSGLVSSIGNNIENQLDLISSLSEVTNYSLLAYEACDNSLKDKLNSLIDSLFDSKEGGEGFKKLISSLIEDRDNDGILEYKLNTDFDYVYNNLIPTQKYVDEDGNILYFNNLGNFLTADGNNIKINYGGEDFTVTVGENGCAILRDSKGNPIDIFGDYNLPSEQYGGDQRVFLYNIKSLLQDKNINAVLDKFCPGATYEEKMAYLHHIALVGCGHVALTNMVFKMMEGYEEDFKNNFGYPMYDLTYHDGSVSVNYNYEPLIVELYSEDFKTNWLGETRSIKQMTHCGGVCSDDLYKLEYYLINKYHIYDYNTDEKVIFRGCGYGYNLYGMDNSIIEDGGGHAVIQTENTNTGEKYVSSWGNKYNLEVLPRRSYVGKNEFPLPEHGGYNVTCDHYYKAQDRINIVYSKENGEAYINVYTYTVDSNDFSHRDETCYRVIYHDWHDGDEDCFTIIKDGE